MSENFLEREGKFLADQLRQIAQAAEGAVIGADALVDSWAEVEPLVAGAAKLFGQPELAAALDAITAAGKATADALADLVKKHQALAQACADWKAKQETTAK